MLPYNKPFYSSNIINKTLLELETQKIPPSSLEGLIELSLSNGAYAILTGSCSSALDAIIHFNIQSGDEVIMPSFYFPSALNLLLRKNVHIKFCDVDIATGCISYENLLSSISPKTKAVIYCSYGGNADRIDAIEAYCKKKNIFLIIDAAQSFGVTYKSRNISCYGDIGCYSFHPAKTIHSGMNSGAIIVKDIEKNIQYRTYLTQGCNKDLILGGKVTRYCWEYEGIHGFMSTIGMKILYENIRSSSCFFKERRIQWNRYYTGLSQYFQTQVLSPFIDNFNAHIFYFVLPDNIDRSVFLNDMMNSVGIIATSHFEALSMNLYLQALLPYTLSSCPNSSILADKIVRLPIHEDITPKTQEILIEYIINYCSSSNS